MALRRGVTSVLAVACALTGACTNSTAHDGINPRLGSSAADPLPRADRMFVENAVVSGQRELEHGKVAEQRASQDAVKAYAARMVAAHTSANEELTGLLERKGAVLTDWSKQQPGSDGQNGSDDRTSATKAGGRPSGSASTTGTTGASGTVATLGEAMERERSGQTYPWLHQLGEDFDEGYVAHRIKAQQDAIGLFSQQTNIGGDPELTEYAAKHLPALREHLRETEALRSALRPR